MLTQVPWCKFGPIDNNWNGIIAFHLLLFRHTDGSTGFGPIPSICFPTLIVWNVSFLRFFLDVLTFSYYLAVWKSDKSRNVIEKGSADTGRGFMCWRGWDIMDKTVGNNKTVNCKYLFSLFDLSKGKARPRYSFVIKHYCAYSSTSKEIDWGRGLSPINPWVVKSDHLQRIEGFSHLHEPHTRFYSRLIF